MCAFIYTIGVVKAQSNFIPGSITTINEQEIKGFIDYQNWLVNPEEVSFKTSLEAEEEVYKPSEIKSFETEGEIYKSAKVEVAISSRKLDDLKFSKTIYTENKEVFLQTLYQGNKSLFKYVDKRNVDHYYIYLNSAYVLLKFKKYLYKNQGVRKLKENKTYIGQLLLYLQGCEGIKSKIRTTKYTQKKLTNLFESYGTCVSEKEEFVREVDDIKINYGVLAGVSSTTIDFKSSGFEYLTESDFKNSINISGGVFMNIALPRSFHKFSFYNDIIYTNFNYKEKHTTTRSLLNKTDNDIKLEMSYIKLNTLFKYKIPLLNKFIFRIGGGISNGYMISETNQRIEYTQIREYNRETNHKAVKSTRKYERGYVGTGELMYKQFSLEYRYENTNGFSNLNALETTTKRNYLLLTYSF